MKTLPEQARTAIASDNLAELRQLLEGGLDPNEGGFGALLFLAVGVAKPQAAQILLENGADANLPPDDLHGLTPLMFAAADGNLELVNLLIAHSSVNQVDKHGRSAIFHAAMSAEGDAAKCLKRLAGASDLSVRDSLGRNALMILIERGAAELALGLADKTDLSALDNKGRGALAIFVEKNKNNASVDSRANGILAERLSLEAPDDDVVAAAALGLDPMWTQRLRARAELIQAQREAAAVREAIEQAQSEKGPSSAQTERAPPRRI